MHPLLLQKTQNSSSSGIGASRNAENTRDSYCNFWTFKPTRNYELFATHFGDAFTPKSAIDLLKTKAALGHDLLQYASRAENYVPAKLISRPPPRSGRRKLQSWTFAFKGTKMAPSSAHALTCNGIAERPIEEHWTHAQVLMFGCEVPQDLWAESFFHSIPLRNRLPRNRQLPTLIWILAINLYFIDIPAFMKKGFAFIYHSKILEKKTLVKITCLKARHTALTSPCMDSNRPVVEKENEDFILIANVAGKMAVVSKNSCLLVSMKQNLQATFPLSLFRELWCLIG